jgi:hypothetical protein
MPRNLADNPTIRFSATVNGETRHVDMDAEEIGGWAVEWATLGTQGGIPDADDLEGIEIYVMNTESVYREFYTGADEDDFAATLEDITAEVV